MTSYRLTEILLGLLGVVFGCWLIVFDSYKLSPVLAPLRLWGVPEWLMVVWPFVAGLTLLFGRRAWRRTTHLAMFPFWVFVAISIAYTNVALTAVPVYTTIGLIHAVKYVLATVERP